MVRWNSPVSIRIINEDMITLVISILHDIDVKWMYRLFIAFFDTENIWFGEIILSLSKLLVKIW